MCREDVLVRCKERCFLITESPLSEVLLFCLTGKCKGVGLLIEGLSGKMG